MGLFKSAEEKQRERDLELKISNLDRYTGSLSEYNSLMGEEHVVIDTGRAKKYVFVDHAQETELLQELIKKGCTGLIRYVPVECTYYYTNGGHGIPVRKKYPDKEIE